MLYVNNIVIVKDDGKAQFGRMDERRRWIWEVRPDAGLEPAARAVLHLRLHRAAAAPPAPRRPLPLRHAPAQAQGILQLGGGREAFTRDIIKEIKRISEQIFETIISKKQNFI